MSQAGIQPTGQIGLKKMKKAAQDTQQNIPTRYVNVVTCHQRAALIKRLSSIDSKWAAKIKQPFLLSYGKLCFSKLLVILTAANRQADG